MLVKWFTAALVWGVLVGSVQARTLTACMSLLSPDMLFCTDNRDTMLLCDVSKGAVKPDCRTMRSVYLSWRGHPERRTEFYMKLYGAK
jgi:hypothetical protein